MNNDTGEMMPARVHAVHLDVGHVRYPGDRVPVRIIKGSKGPHNVFAGYAACHMGVIRNVQIIVQIQELEITRLHEHDQGNGSQRQTNYNQSTPGSALSIGLTLIPRNVKTIKL